MKLRTRAGTAAALTIASLTALSAGTVSAAFAAPPAPGHADPGAGFGPGSGHGAATGGPAVFVETDDPAGNQVVAYARTGDGALTEAGAYRTGGLGGVLSGSVVDHQASQGALALDAGRSLLFATNAGSDTVSVFSVRGAALDLLQVVPSGGDFPVSVAVHGDLLYVLDARSGGRVSGYVIDGRGLVPLPGSTRQLGLDPTATPEFVNTPGQVAFSPDGRHLLVTTKANGNDIDVFTVNGFGTLSGRPVVDAEPGAVPFSVAFTSGDVLQVVEAGPDALASFRLDPDGALTPIDTSLSGQSASCWITRIGPYSYVSSAGSGSLTTYSANPAGGLTDLGNTATDAGTTDSVATPGGAFLYVRAGAAGQVDEYAVHPGGSLTEIGSVTVPDAVGGEGIAAS